MAVGWKTVRIQGRHFMCGQDVSDRNPEISAIPCFFVRNCYLCVCLVKSVMQKRKKDAGRKS